MKKRLELLRQLQQYKDKNYTAFLQLISEVLHDAPVSKELKEPSGQYRNTPFEAPTRADWTVAVLDALAQTDLSMPTPSIMPKVEKVIFDSPSSGHQLEVDFTQEQTTFIQPNAKNMKPFNALPLDRQQQLDAFINKSLNRYSEVYKNLA